ncbi:VOC family protein [Vibrio sp. 404]|uniref:VOC family protein n=1 Tax=Vibrio marinisediminis TaxID=2758441 RepID=A0A7W2IS58_9VIBR|nr:VOC family protein [Vibrio marinisediminis]MBA5760989.1 VOC family protein [Vibrio marinisediminis]
MIRINGLDHIVLRAHCLDNMLYFYRDLLGCQIERSLPQLGLTQLRAGEALIDIVTINSELGQLGGAPPTQDGRNVDHFCLQIDPIEEEVLIAILEQLNITHSGFAERYGAQGFGRSIYLSDPEGNIVELKPNKEMK